MWIPGLTWTGVEFPDSPLVQPPFSQCEVSNFFTLGQVSAHTVDSATSCACALFTALTEPFPVSPEPTLREAPTSPSTAPVRALQSRREAQYLCLSIMVLHQSLALCQCEVIAGISEIQICAAVNPFRVSFQIFRMVEVYISIPRFVLHIELLVPTESPVHRGDVVSMLSMMPLSLG